MVVYVFLIVDVQLRGKIKTRSLSANTLCVQGQDQLIIYPLKIPTFREEEGQSQLSVVVMLRSLLNRFVEEDSRSKLLSKNTTTCLQVNEECSSYVVADHLLNFIKDL